MEGNGTQEYLPLHLGVDHESLQRPESDPRKKGGWITFPFLAVAVMGVGVAMSGAMSNLVVYLIQEYNVPSVDAAQIVNIVGGCLSLAPVTGAIVADAFFGCYPIIVVSMAFSVLSVVVFTLTSSLHSLRPPPCNKQLGSGGGPCSPASAGQMAVLYAGVFLMCMCAAGSRFNQATMGADQFDSPADREVLFNWFFIFSYASSVLGSTVIVYVQDTVSWTLGFGIAGAASVVGLAGLLLGSRYYRRPAVRESPFTGLARVIVAAASKRKVNVKMLSGESRRFYHGGRSGDGHDKMTNGTNIAPTDSFSFLNRAALVTDDDLISASADGWAARPWRICTVQQVEDFKAVLRILPVWSAAIFLSVAIGVQINFTILQALAMDRVIGHFTVPAGSMAVSCFMAGVIFLGLLDRVLIPLWRRLTGHTLTPLQRIGAGHVVTIISIAASAVIERRRVATVLAAGKESDPGWVSPMSALWLVLPFALSGAGEAFHFPGQVTLYYQEFPAELKNTATGMVAMIVALGLYLSTALIGIVRHTTSWLPDNMNASRLENLYWLLAGLVAINFGYYLSCARFYKYQNVRN